MSDSSLTPATSGACPFCLSLISSDEAKENCPSCRAVHHHECWTENGGCAVYGCTCVPAAESRGALEIPVSYWGQEHKPCPSCSQEILAAAVRCRHCGATFQSARPQDAAEFRNRSELADRLPAAGKRVVVIFILSVIPFLAPVGAVWGLVWGRANRESLAALPPLYGALHRIGLIAAISLTFLLVLTTTIYSVVRGG